MRGFLFGVVGKGWTKPRVGSHLREKWPAPDLIFFLPSCDFIKEMQGKPIVTHPPGRGSGGVTDWLTVFHKKRKISPRRIVCMFYTKMLQILRSSQPYGPSKIGLRIQCITLTDYHRLQWKYTKRTPTVWAPLLGGIPDILDFRDLVPPYFRPIVIHRLHASELPTGKFSVHHQIPARFFLHLGGCISVFAFFFFSLRKTRPLLSSCLVGLHYWKI